MLKIFTDRNKMTKMNWFRFSILIIACLILNFFRYPLAQAIVNIFIISTGTIFFYLIYKIIENVLFKFEIKLNQQQKDAILWGIFYIILSCQLFICLEVIFFSSWFVHSLSQILMPK